MRARIGRIGKDRLRGLGSPPNLCSAQCLLHGYGCDYEQIPILDSKSELTLGIHYGLFTPATYSLVSASLRAHISDSSLFCLSLATSSFIPITVNACVRLSFRLHRASRRTMHVAWCEPERHRNRPRRPVGRHAGGLRAAHSHVIKH